jgi:SulP family sulfate permease
VTADASTLTLPSRDDGLRSLLRREFRGYSAGDLRADIVAGLTVAAVALPLALAFGVVSGADAAAGLVTAILAGLIIGGLGGSPYQISGPTGAMSAVLVVVAAHHGLAGVWLAGVLAGLLIFLMGLLRLGKLVTLIPSPVIVGFTSGIAAIIAVGQLPNVLGIAHAGGESTVAIFWAMVLHLGEIDPRTLLLAGVVAVCMVGLPRLLPSVPSSLVGIAAAAGLAGLLGWSVPTIGEIPRSIMLDNRLTPDLISPTMLNDVLPAAISIAVLGAVESLLCGTVAGNLTGIRLDSRQELLAQGIGNVIIPFFGGVPSTAAIARTGVGLSAGGRTRLTSVFHSLALLVAALVAAPLLAMIPLAALGGVLLVTAVRMNEWQALHFFAHRRLWHALAAMGVTLAATVALDLTQAIILGMGVSALLFLRQASAIVVSHEAVDPDRIARLPDVASASDIDARADLHANIRVVYVTGPLFFGSVATFLDAVEAVPSTAHLVLSLRGMPTVDHMGVEAIREVIDRQRDGGGDVQLAGVQPSVADELTRTGVLDHLGRGRVHWSADQAIRASALAAPADELTAT